MRFLVVVPVYNGPDLLERCLQSIAEQDDDEFDVLVADDASTDRAVAETIYRFFETQDRGLISYYRIRSENVGATRNLVEAIRWFYMEPEDVVLVVDGDDRLAHPQVLSRLREIYEAPWVDLSYGSYEPDPPNENCPPAVEIPFWVLKAGCIRLMCLHDRMPWNHPISFRRRLFDALSDDDFMMGDEWMRHGYDVTLMCPLIELAGTRVHFCDEVLYTYTSDRPEAVYLTHQEATATENLHVISQPRKYEPLESL